jgi:hypothetical protein
MLGLKESSEDDPESGAGKSVKVHDPFDLPTDDDDGKKVDAVSKKKLDNDVDADEMKDSEVSELRSRIISLYLCHLQEVMCELLGAPFVRSHTKCFVRSICVRVTYFPRKNWETEQRLWTSRRIQGVFVYSLCIASRTQCGIHFMYVRLCPIDTYTVRQ